MLKTLLLAIIPIFVAVDALGAMPIYISLTQGLERSEKNRVVLQSCITAIILASFFVLLGRWVFAILGITKGDFMVAGGLILFVFALVDLLLPEKRRRKPSGDVGSVPIGTPLIVGPAVLTTCLIVIEQYGIAMTLISVIVNVLFAGLVLCCSSIIVKLLGASGAKALSKIMMLLLASISVMMVRKGLLLLLNLEG